MMFIITKILIVPQAFVSIHSYHHKRTEKVWDVMNDAR